MNKVKSRKVYIDKHGSPFILEGVSRSSHGCRYFHMKYAGFNSTGDLPKPLRLADESEIKAFWHTIFTYRARRAARTRREKKLLALCGLKRSDFCRLRDVFIDKDDPGILYVRTRENGIHGRSIEAIHNENYLDSQAEGCGDSTYEWYRFRIPGR